MKTVKEALEWAHKAYPTDSNVANEYIDTLAAEVARLQECCQGESMAKFKYEQDAAHYRDRAEAAETEVRRLEGQVSYSDKAFEIAVEYWDASRSLAEAAEAEVVKLKGEFVRGKLYEAECLIEGLEAKLAKAMKVVEAARVDCRDFHGAESCDNNFCCGCVLCTALREFDKETGL